jgi:hypothetical protein
MVFVLMCSSVNAQSKIGEVYGFTFMPDGNSVIGIAKRADGIKVRTWDITDPNTITETNSFDMKDFEDIDVVGSQYKLSTSLSGEYVAIVRKARLKPIDNIHIYKIKNGKHVATVKTDKLFNGCDRHMILTLEFSSDDKHLFISEMHHDYLYNISTGNIKPLFKDKPVIMIAYDIYGDVPIIASEKLTTDGVCPDKKDVYIVNGKHVTKINYDAIPPTHNRFVRAIYADIVHHKTIRKIDNWQSKLYWMNKNSNKLLARTGTKKIIEIYVTH